MTALAITIGHACTNCGECDKLLPGVRAEIARLGSLFVNVYNPDADFEAITEAVQNCPVGAFTIDAI